MTRTNAEIVGVAPGTRAFGQRTDIYALRIVLSDGSSVDVDGQIEDPLGKYGPFAASIGQVLPVFYDPGNPSKFKVDWDAYRASADQFRAEVAAESARQAAEGPSSNPKADLIRLSIIRAKREGNATEAERLTAMLADVESGGSPGSSV
jgi:hypothetical protein